MRQIWKILFVVALMGVALAAYEAFHAKIVSETESPETSARSEIQPVNAGTSRLPALDAHGVNGIEEISRLELDKLMSATRPLSRQEKANIDRGCPGLVSTYQGLGLTKWPESAPGAVAYLRLDDALKRTCPEGLENFIFVKQGCWLENKPPTPRANSGEVAVDAVTRTRPGLYTFNYAVYFPSTRTYLWMNYHDYGFPLNVIKPQRAYLSPFPPPLDNHAPCPDLLFDVPMTGATHQLA